MSLISSLKFIINHPINRDHRINSVLRFFKWQINSSLNPYPVIYQFTERAKLIVKKGMTGATGNLYCGLHEYNDMLFLLHFLRNDDLFIDVGANVGSYTILAAAHVGAETISFEPVPATFLHLTGNISINHMEDNVKAYNIAIGAKTGSISFTTTLDTVNHVATQNDKDIIEVPLDTLDNMLGERIPALIKIDVEGFETEVINGALNTLENEHLKAIIIELNGSGLRYGYKEMRIHEKLLSKGFTSFIYNPSTRALITSKQFGTHNTIYIRDRLFVEQRLQSADKIRILRKLI